MGKHGPCYHCGVTSTPLWRNGPPEKPILCNACGSRWRTKGSLVNYTPLHSRAEHEQYEEYKIPRPNILSIQHKKPKVLKRKPNYENKLSVGTSHDYKYGSIKAIDEHNSNRSSLGSAISSVSENGLQYSSVDTSELTGPAAPLVMWGQTVPSRKRTCLSRPKQSQLEKLTKDLYTILHEQQSSHFSLSSYEDLLFDSDEPMVAVEIGHGSVLIRHPSSIDEESEASSISVENKAHLRSDYYSLSPSSPLYVSNVEIENNERPFGQGIQKEQVNNWDKDAHDKLSILENHNSPLCYLYLKKIINYEVFASHMTNEEQQQLLQFLPELDTATLPNSLQSMFANPRFEESLVSFQKLLSDGVFDVKTEECGRLKKLALSSFQKSTWVEQYSSLKEKEAKSSRKEFVPQQRNNLLAYGSSTNVKKSRDDPFQFGSGTKTMMKKNSNLFNLAKNVSSFTPRRSLFFMMDTFQHANENLEHDLLLDVPNNNFLPEAELFYQ